MYGVARPPMINTYKKLAQVYTGVGDPNTAMEFFSKAEQLCTEFKAKGEVAVADPGSSEKDVIEARKREATEMNQMYF